MEKKIVKYSECKCDAVTLFFEDNNVNSISKKNLKKFNISLKNVPKFDNISYQCNHCVNNYGLDLCECGSGKTPEKCCHKGSKETFGQSVKFVGWTK